MATLTDTMSFDGSCNPNPNGTMGWSFIITRTSGAIIQHHGERAPQTGNTVNVAEYLGLRDGLRAYVEAGGTGPLHISGDSQLIINQVKGTYAVRKSELKPYHAEVSALLDRIPGATVVWNRREFNQAADQLARSATPPSQPASAERVMVADALQEQLAPAVRLAITTLNQLAAPGFKDFAQLRTGGLDAVSALPLANLKDRLPAHLVDQVVNTFPQDEKAQAAALRWVTRGLDAGLAVRKVEVDAALHAQTTGAPTRKRRTPR